MSILVCETCGFVFNAAFDPALLIYDATYANDQSASPAFRGHIADRAERIKQVLPKPNATIVEIGCGQGDFLRLLVNEASPYTGIGYDPSFNSNRLDLQGRLRFEARLYEPATTVEQADAVLCRNVIEHIPQPIDFLNGIRQSLAAGASVLTFFETPDVDYILRNFSIWDFYYEHCSYFSLGTLTWAFEASGFETLRAEHGFGDQYLWLESRSGTATRGTYAIETVRLANEFAQVYDSKVTQWRDRTRRARQQGALAVWGAGAKGVTFANITDPEGSYIACIVDVNTAPGSGHRVVSPEEMLS